jgi:hypothetical protein
MRTDIFVAVLAMVTFGAALWWIFQHGPGTLLNTLGP